MTGVSERSQQRGNLKDNGYILLFVDVRYGFAILTLSGRLDMKPKWLKKN
ncbi:MULTISPECIES: hypothetical protein [Photorhabdus]|uniref:Uncharacterized protein n=1 Tax=Photorhabdus kayaii TaxID=230088 RepID=A0ABX0AX57_9GAMM|nr:MULTISPECIES: hypothetical protein [Photorhabdus]MCC8373162.1 hypothetical protein [Photorhabdus bodei]MCT8351885.1 hypothetical protein [Photorhabdus kayaii]MDB6367050.1 hypothetical protein [Photorhabdus bodei]NDL11784.1 hypothetical protein [Photorhabdus kayaii]NDL25418.1 hypothetical protein [Photorhabdus kayaii]